MTDIACVCSAPIIGEVRTRGLDPLPLLAGLDLSLADLEDPRGRIPWRDFVVFAERAEKMLGKETLEELAAAATVAYVPAPIRRILPRLRDSRPLFTLAARWWGPWVFHGTRGTCEVLPDGRLREIVQILPEYPACPEFLSGIRGTLRAMPRLLDQPDALVTLVQDGREGEFLITPPPRRGRSRRRLLDRRPRFGRGLGWRARRQLARAEDDLEELGFAREQLLVSKRSAQSMSALLDEQSRRLDALRELGLTLVRDSDIDALQRDIVRLLRQQLDLGGVRLSRHGGEERRMREAAAGSLAGAPTQTWPLRIADRTIGLLELWGVGAKDPLAPLQDLLPWIAIAIESGGSKALVAQLLTVLEEDVRDWSRVEQRLEQTLARHEPAPSPGPGRTTAAHTGTTPAFWSLGDLGAVDLAQFLHALTPRLRQLAGDGVQLELRSADDLCLALTGGGQAESFLEDVVEILRDLGSEQIRIETRAVPMRRYAELRGTTAEILIWGRGRSMAPTSRSRLLSALGPPDRGLFAADLEIRSEADGTVSVRVRLPLLAPVPGGSPH
jgi:hypothetical protein